MDVLSAKQQRLAQLPCIAHHPADLETLFDASSFRARLHQAISEAQHRIYIVALYLQDDEAGRAILDSLYQAKQKNPALDIKVFVDWHRAQRGLIGAAASDGNAALYRQYAEKYEHAIEIYGVPVKNREVFGVLHLKGFIVDDQVIYSGASLNDVYLAQHERYRYDRYHILRNQSLADSMAQYVLDNMLESDAVNCLAQPCRPSTKSLKPAIRQLRGRLQHASYQFEPQRVGDEHISLTPVVGLGKRRNRLNFLIQTLLASAQHEITICTPYFNLPKSLSKEVRNAMRRGVKVTIIVGDKTANDFYIPPSEPFRTIGGLPYLYEVNLRKFAKRHQQEINDGRLNLHLWRHDDNSFHLKGIWIDQRYMLITGSNLNPRAWKLDLENAILIQDPQGHLREQKQRELDCILTHTTRLNSYLEVEDLEQYPMPVKRLLKRLRRVKVDAILSQIL
ncbi:CDP-diacylglycerol--serine O-phosphatidyltransferase [Vibrio stylophorae]|uniref:CDP-diacylglycerol--serine O-phosphatidyltransferase n=1 Tax=Vibrio stylophorae TaxID=659351 RepID=A0ABM8ZQI7_9VIBR|nr:CDP-diacylglycerol--serine O-phosphatidyltransferase [Vibrio stylophorae]CAH0532570.1 CDP-diacylglycerol--serine O-phosphatidyltransferase [Vibrio stylophorae]